MSAFHPKRTFAARTFEVLPDLDGRARAYGGSATARGFIVTPSDSRPLSFDLRGSADDLDLPVPLDRIAYRRSLDMLISRGLIEGSRLTEYGREVEVLSCLAAGMSNKQVARSLGISVRTVTVHVSNLLRKTGSASRTEAALWAVEHQFAGPSRRS